MGKAVAVALCCTCVYRAVLMQVCPVCFLVALGVFTEGFLLEFYSVANCEPSRREVKEDNELQLVVHTKYVDVACFLSQ